MSHRGIKRIYRKFVGDFETTVFPGQTSTEVWASALVEIGTENVEILGSIDETFDYLAHIKGNVIVYYHNLKFDGSFWLYFLLHRKNYRLAWNEDHTEFLPDYKMPNGSYSYVISDRGQWYKIVIKSRNKIIELRDSLKLLPFTVRALGPAFETKHRKLNMEYTGFRYAGCEITPEEKKYIANDVLVVKEALEAMFERGHDKLTIGRCCLEELIKSIGKEECGALFPDLTREGLNEEIYGSANVDAYIRRSYRGGWCYLVDGKQNRLFARGVTADVNSLYPSMMHSESGNFYPVGEPTFWKGNFIPDKARDGRHYFFIRIRTRFYIKQGMLPFIQIKGSMFYRGTEMLTSSDVLINRKTGEKSAFLVAADGSLIDTRVTLTLTCVDYDMFLKHYDPWEFEILDGCFFDTMIGLFDNYINKYRTLKINAPNKAIRTLAKLFLNNSYGQFSKSDDSTFEVAALDENDRLIFTDVEAHNKKPGYIPIGSAITSYARRFTITAAQANLYGVNKPGFIYADTDSIHCDLAPDQVKGIKIDNSAFGCWKLESSWDKGLFVRQKTYIEHVTEENLKPISEPYYNIKCAGMPETCKDLFLRSVAGDAPTSGDSDEAKEFLQSKRSIKDFKSGLRIPGKLMPKRIPGGTLLVDSFYEIRG